MWKTGWVMEWEIEVRYGAPLRAHFNLMCETFGPLARAFRQFEKSVQEALKTFTRTM